jgi:tetratricopeptide (TPR) repeat protein
MKETYTVGSFFLRVHLNQPREAEAFLREGLLNNPDSYEILFELGLLYDENYHDTNRARNVWELAVRKLIAQPRQAQKENRLVLEQITANLANLEREAGNYEDAVRWFQAAQKVSLDPGSVQRQIDALEKKLATSSSPTNRLVR